MGRHSFKIGILLYMLLFAAALSVTGHGIKMLRTRLLVMDIIQAGIDYDAFRMMHLDSDAIVTIEKRFNRLVRKNPQLKGCSYIDSIGYLTFSMMANDYDLIRGRIPDGMTFVKGVTEIAGMKCFRELYGYYREIFTGLSCFPVPFVEGDADISYEDTWYVLRSYGGRRRHEGTDLMASNNERGYFPVLSITDGIIENIGWLEKGGNRIGIRTEAGGYFYYAHLDSYASGLKQGDRVYSGRLIGFMGDTGYGSEGTTGKFDVHLHLGVYVRDSSGEMSINPYNLLRLLEDSRQHYKCIKQ